MSRKAYYISGFKGDDRFVDHALEVREQGVIREGADQTGSEWQSAGRGRVRQHDAAIGLDTEDVHMGGDRVVTRAETPEIVSGRATGDVLQVVDRYDDSGKFTGSYEVRWTKTARGTHVISGNRRVFY
jgi:hypothetical protein